MAAVHSRWDKFELMLQSHSLMIKEQIDVMKGGVESRKEALLVSVQKFAARWDALKPKDGALDKPDLALAAICLFFVQSPDPLQLFLKSIVATIKEKRIEFDELVKASEAIQADCAHFGLPALEISQLLEVRTDIEQTESVWLFLEEVSSYLLQEVFCCLNPFCSSCKK